MKESAIQKSILDYLTAERVFAFRLNTGGAKVTGGFLRSHSLGAGAADILALPTEITRLFGGEVEYNTALWIEVKNSKGQQSPEQKSFQLHVENLGHSYLLARSVDDVIALLQGRRNGSSRGGKSVLPASSEMGAEG